MLSRFGGTNGTKERVSSRKETSQYGCGAVFCCILFLRVNKTRTLRIGTLLGLLTILVGVSLGVYVFIRGHSFISFSREQTARLSYFIDSQEGGEHEVRITDDKTGKVLCTAQTGKGQFDTHQIANILMRYRCQIFKDTASTDKQVNNYLFQPQENNSYLIVPLSNTGDNRLAKVYVEYGYGSLKQPFDTSTYSFEELSVAPPGNVFQLASKNGEFFIYVTYEGSPYDEHSTSTYSLYDSGGQVLLSNFHRSYDKHSIFFDPYNYGFLFLDVTPAAMTDDQYGRRKFTYSYLSLYDTPTFHTLETHEDEVNVDGKGCSLIAEFHSGFVVLESCAAPISAPGKSSSLILKLPR